MDGECEHDWRIGPIAHADLHRSAICVKCLGRPRRGWLHRDEAVRWPEWTEQDYLDNFERLEGRKA